MGLTISRALCQLMCYRVEVRSEEGKGSTFSVVFAPEARLVAPPPVATAPVAAPPTTLPVRESKAAEQSRLVLVIDDEADSRILLANLLEECGCRVITADSGPSALMRAREVKPDLILLDLMMPQMNGWQVLQAIKNDPVLAGIPVAISSIVARENRGSIIGAVDILQKPVAREDLLRVIRTYSRPKVLVVEDTEFDRQFMIYCLEAEGIEFRTAVNGREALEVLKQFSPDLILLDLVMPEMDGMVFLEHLRRDPQHEHLPVFIVTAKELTPAEIEVLNRQSQAILKKTGDLAADLKRLVSGTGAGSEVVIARPPSTVVSERSSP